MSSARSSIELSPAPVVPPETASPGNQSAQSDKRTAAYPVNAAPDLWTKIHRALRGRYALVILLAVAGGTLGAAVGWNLAPRVFRSEGIVRIASTLPSVLQETDQNRPIAMFDAFLQSQQALIKSRKLIDAALQDPAWRDVQRPAQPPTAEQFAAGLNAEVRPRSDCLRISYTDPDPLVAAAGVRAMVNAYQRVFERERNEFERQRLELLEQRRASVAAELRRQESELAAAEIPAVKPEIKPVPVRELAPEEIAMRDPVMRRYFDEQWQREDQLALARMSRGESHPEILRLKSALERAEQKVAQYAEQFHAYAPTVERKDPEPIPVVSTLHRRLQESADEARRELAHVSRRIEILKTEGAAAERLSVVTAGDVPLKPHQNAGKKLAALGALAGGGLPVVLLIMLGMAFRRYDRAAYAAEDLAANVPFFAVLPAVRQKAPEDSLAAAHAIHRIRIKLQPRRLNDSVTCLVTSASHGEGKTGVAAALAFAFAAAGNRTLLIDADFQRRMLTRAFKAEDSPGLAEMLSGGGELKEIARTRGGLAVLPTGQAQQANVGTLSGTALQKLLLEARQAFDVVVIDGGCVNQSPEALTLAALVDGVVGVVSRGQTPARVQRTLQEMRSVGASIAGVIFNRTAAREFYAAVQISPAHIRRASPTAAPPAETSRFGPLAAAVLHSVQLTRSEDTELLTSGEPRLAKVDAAEPAVAADAARRRAKGPVAA